MMLAAPMAFAVSKLTRPIGPAPQTSTFWPIVTPARRHAWTPTDSGSSRAPSSNDTLLGSLRPHTKCRLFMLVYYTVDLFRLYFKYFKTAVQCSVHKQTSQALAQWGKSALDPKPQTGATIMLADVTPMKERKGSGLCERKMQNYIHN